MRNPSGPRDRASGIRAVSGIRPEASDGPDPRGLIPEALLSRMRGCYRPPLDVASHTRPLARINRRAREERVQRRADGRAMALLRQMRRAEQRAQAAGRPGLVNLSAVDELPLPIVEKTFGCARRAKRARNPLAFVVQERTGQLHGGCQTLQALSRI